MRMATQECEIEFCETRIERFTLCCMKHNYILTSNISSPFPPSPRLQVSENITG